MHVNIYAYVGLTDIFPNFTQVSSCLRKSNYALFPFIKVLISAGGLRNMEQNSE